MIAAAIIIILGCIQSQHQVAAAKHEINIPNVISKVANHLMKQQSAKTQIKMTSRNLLGVEEIPDVEGFGDDIFFGDGDDAFALDESFAMMGFIFEAMDDIKTCIDIDNLVSKVSSSVGGQAGGGGGGDELVYDDDFFGIIEDMEVLDSDCSANNAKKFQSALNNFETCADFNLEDFIETVPSALVGSTLRCMQSFVTSPGDDPNLVPLEGLRTCLQTIMGNNPFGSALRNFYFYPDKVCPCLKVLGSAVPRCTLDVWPIPLMGSLVELSTCLIDTLFCSDNLDGFCGNELEILDVCLPDQDQKMDCGRALEQCIEDGSMAVSLLLPGSPLPDACRRLYNTYQHDDNDPDNDYFFRTNSHLLDRYKRFNKNCGDPAWKSVFQTTSSSIELHSSFTKSQHQTNNNSNDNEDSGGFVKGIFGGMVISALLLAVAMYMRRSPMQSAQYTSTPADEARSALHSSDLELT